MNGEVGMGLSYLIRYGLWHQVGRFASDSPDLERGETVVVRSHRGTELGEVLIRVESPPGITSPPSSAETARVLRAATCDDLDRARRLELERPRRFDLCQRIIQDREAALELIDVEPLLDDRTVLHYLGPHHLDVTGLLATLHSTCNIDGLFAPVGGDV
jgi:cell fate regulator YaaT (PSP1 superfamily)